MLLRYLFNLRGDSLIGGAVKNDATRTSAADIENYIGIEESQEGEAGYIGVEAGSIDEEFEGFAV